MVLPFKEEVVNGGEFSTENFKHPNFIGFLNPYGQVIDFSRPLGLGGHDNNPSTEIVREYFHFPERDMDKEREKAIANIKRERLQPIIEDYRNHYLIYEKYGRRRSERNPYALLDEDLYTFFYRCYEAETFREGLGKDPTILSEREFFNQYCKDQESYRPTASEVTMAYGSRVQRMVKLDYTFYRLNNLYQQFKERFSKTGVTLPYPQLMSKEEYLVWCQKNKSSYYPQKTETTVDYNQRIKRTFDYDYHWYKVSLIIDWFKTIMVQYLHYHYIDRLGLGITTSSFIPNEEFYNYQLNGFKIHQIPKMVWNRERKTHEELVQNEFLVSDRELRLGEEIQSLRKRISQEELAKYYR